MTHISWSPLVAFLVLVSNSAFSQSAEEATPPVASAQAAPARICVAAPNAQMGQGTEAALSVYEDLLHPYWQGEMGVGRHTAKAAVAAG